MIAGLEGYFSQIPSITSNMLLHSLEVTVIKHPMIYPVRKSFSNGPETISIPYRKGVIKPHLF